MATETDIENVINQLFSAPGNTEIIQNMFSRLRSADGSELATVFDSSQQLIQNAMNPEPIPLELPFADPAEQVPLELPIVPILTMPENLSHLPVIPHL